MSKLKPSTAKKNAHSVYAKNGTAEKNKRAKLARHMKAHPTDAQSKSCKPGARAGLAHSKRTPLEASIKRAVSHTLLFGSERKVSGRDLSTSKSRKAFLDSLKTKPSISKAK